MNVLPEVLQINNGYLITPCSYDMVNALLGIDECYGDHSWGWAEYAIWSSEYIYPYQLDHLANLGITFGWEYVCTEDFSYYAYNFPTEDSKNNLVTFKTGKRKGLPRLTKKLRKQLEDTSAANELLYKLGLNNGTN